MSRAGRLEPDTRPAPVLRLVPPAAGEDDPPGLPAKVRTTRAWVLQLRFLAALAGHMAALAVLKVRPSRREYIVLRNEIGTLNGRVDHIFDCMARVVEEAGIALPLEPDRKPAPRHLRLVRPDGDGAA